VRVLTQHSGLSNANVVVVVVVVVVVLRVTVLIHTILRVQFVAQYLLTTAPTCFGHRIWASSGSYKLYRSIQLILQVVTG
jgi:hypothetical protein